MLEPAGEQAHLFEQHLDRGVGFGATPTPVRGTDEACIDRHLHQHLMPHTRGRYLFDEREIRLARGGRAIVIP